MKKLHRVLEYTNHLSNVLTVLSDKKLYNSTTQTYSAQIISTSDYYPFGLSMYGKQYDSGRYRFGFNGKENDTEYGSSQLVQDYGFRIYNPSIGRFLSVDPLSRNYPYYTPYQFAANSSIRAIDLDGLEDVITINSRTVTTDFLNVVLVAGLDKGIDFLYSDDGESYPQGYMFSEFSDSKHSGWLEKLAARSGVTANFSMVATHESTSYLPEGTTVVIGITDVEDTKTHQIEQVYATFIIEGDDISVSIPEGTSWLGPGGVHFTSKKGRGNDSNRQGDGNNKSVNIDDLVTPGGGGSGLSPDSRLPYALKHLSNAFKQLSKLKEEDGIEVPAGDVTTEERTLNIEYEYNQEELNRKERETKPGEVTTVTTYRIYKMVRDSSNGGTSREYTKRDTTQTMFKKEKTSENSTRFAPGR